MRKFCLKPHEIGYLKLLYSTFAGIDYATANAAVGASNAKSFKAEKNFKTLREVNIKACQGLASEYIRAALIQEHLIENDSKLFCSFDPSDENTEGEVQVWTEDELREERAKNNFAVKEGK